MRVFPQTKLNSEVLRYSSEPATISEMEKEWLHLKRDELQGRVYGDEDELVLGII